ncbi:hypothetical protein HDU87_004964 [Geranomyces variabilis]|uniref:Trichome birefringence-like C-terminal domain-containing protein n=1 Tax=Geranomyces variabilis TaxID=109894 RepID=A0AAD5THH7_9FUNG|nr:hypothetical protein HDU87_004964 [Geranomyces variabilis]
MAPEYARLPTSNSSSSLTSTTIASSSSKKPSTLCIIFPLLALTALVSSVLTAYSPSLVAHLAKQQQQQQPQSTSSPIPPYATSVSATTSSQPSWKRIASDTNWRNSAAYRTAYASCPLLDTQDKCEQARYDRLLAWEWTTNNANDDGLLRDDDDLLAPPGGRTRRRRPRDVVEKCLAGRTLGFSGDSLSRQSFHSLACLLHADGATLSISKSGSLDVVRASFVNTSSAPVTLLWTGDSLNPYLLAYTGSRPEPTINYTTLHPTLTELISANLDYLVLNTGLWVDASSFRSRVQDFYQAYTQIIRSALALLLPQLESQHAKLIFRTSPVRHFQNGDYSSDGSCPDLVPNFNASAITYFGGFAETLQNEKLKEILAATPGVSMLDAAEIAFARADAHRSETDCSHYCLPGVPDFWNEVLLQSIWDTCEKSDE